MRKFRVNIIETTIGYLDVEAETIDEAKERALDDIANGVLIQDTEYNTEFETGDIACLKCNKEVIMSKSTGKSFPGSSDLFCQC